MLRGKDKGKVKTIQNPLLNLILLEFVLDEIKKLLKVKFQREFKFMPERKFKFDYYFSDIRLAIEYEGGVFNFGGHSRGRPYTNNCDKYNFAVYREIKVLRFTAAHFYVPKRDKPTKNSIFVTANFIYEVVKQFKVRN